MRLLYLRLAAVLCMTAGLVAQTRDQVRQNPSQREKLRVTQDAWLRLQMVRFLEGLFLSGGTLASFDLFLPMLLRFEGGFVDDPTDPGGETNLGITMATFQYCSHELLGIDPTSENLRTLTDAQAGIIYRTLYWDKMSGDAIQLQDLANIVCDFYVNAGTHATILLQQIVNSMGANVVEDGVVGPATIQALNGLDQTEVYRRYKQSRIGYYQNLGQRFPQFLQGWLNRVNAFPNL